MATAYTSLLGLALPVTGELSGTWGDVVNNYLTGYVDASVAGAQTISGSQTSVTLSTTNGSALTQAGGAGITGSAQYQIINCTGNPSGTLTITAPASSKTYIVINATSTSQSVKIVGTGPTTGVTIASGDKALVAWNGSDFVRVGASVGGSNTQVQYNNGGNLAGSANMTFDGTKLTVGGVNNTALTASKPVFTDGSKNLVSTGTMPVDQGGTGQTSYTDGQLLIGNTATGGLSKATLTAGSNITITNGNGTISIAAGSTVAIGNITGATANGALYANGSGTVTSGTLPAGSGGTGNAFFSVSGPASSVKTYTFPNANMSVGYLNIPAVGTKTGSYTLATTDVGKYVQVGSGGSITVPDATFSEGDVVMVFNNTTGNITITCSITTAYIAGTDADKATVTLATRGIANIFFISGTVCVITGNVT